LVVGWLIGLPWPLDAGIIQTVVVVALVAGLIAFLLHKKGVGVTRSAGLGRSDLAEVKHDMRELDEDRHVDEAAGKGLRKARREADQLNEHPEDAQDVMLQLRRMLPAQGWLTERMAKLRAKAHRASKGHVARIEELRHAISGLPPNAKRQASRELAERYRQLQMDLRLERLDKAVAETERRIRTVTREAEQAVAKNEFQKVHNLLKAAENLQKHNSKLFGVIDRAEQRLAALAREVAGRSREVSDG